jgi:hypothetical protein
MMADLEMLKSLRTTFAHESVADAATETATLPTGTIAWGIKNLDATGSVTLGHDATDVGATEYWTLEPGEALHFDGAGGAAKTLKIKNASGGAVIVEMYATYLSPTAAKAALLIA